MVEAVKNALSGGAEADTEAELNFRDLANSSLAIEQRLLALSETDIGRDSVLGLVQGYLLDWTKTDWIDPEELFLVGRRLSRIGLEDLNARMAGVADISEQVLEPFWEGYHSYSQDYENA